MHLPESTSQSAPAPTLLWGNTVVEGPGSYYYVGTQSGPCSTLEVADVQVLDPPPLYWNLEGGQLQAPDGWTDHIWMFNGTLLDAEGVSIDVQGAGDYSLLATDPGTGCSVGYTGTVGCPGDLDGDLIVGVSDILALLGSFGCTEACGPGDVNADGVVNVSDILFVLGLFGMSC